MDFERELTFDLSDALFRRALNRFWFRTYGLRLIICAGIVELGLICLSSTVMRGGFLFASWSVFVIIVVLSLVNYTRYMRNSMRIRSKLEDHSVSCRFSNQGVSISSELGSSELKWRAFEKLWKHSDLWFLFMDKNQFLILPTDKLDEDLRDFIEHCIRLTGGGRPKCRQCGYDLRGQQTPRCPECGTPFDEDVLEIEQ